MVITFIVARIMAILDHGPPRCRTVFLPARHARGDDLNYGIFLLAGVGVICCCADRVASRLRGGALAYGFVFAPTFDEFGMWPHLGGSYWQRASVDAIIAVAAILALLGYVSAIRVSVPGTCAPRSSCSPPSSPSLWCSTMHR